MNHLVILSAQLNWNTSATELAQKKKTPEKIELALFSDYDNINAPASYKFKVVLPKGIEGVGYWGIGGVGNFPYLLRRLALLSNSRYRRTFSLKFEDVCSGIGAKKKLLQITLNYVAWI